MSLDPQRNPPVLLSARCGPSIALPLNTHHIIHQLQWPAGAGQAQPSFAAEQRESSTKQHMPRFKCDTWLLGSSGAVGEDRCVSSSPSDGAPFSRGRDGASPCAHACCGVSMSASVRLGTSQEEMRTHLCCELLSTQHGVLLEGRDDGGQHRAHKEFHDHVAHSHLQQRRQPNSS